MDKPRADLLVRMLELMDGSEEDMLQRVRERPLGGVTDAMLLIGKLLPGMRSPVFGIQSSSSKQFSGSLRLHFFYLNVGFENLPMLARVEIPAWVAENPAFGEHTACHPAFSMPDDRQCAISLYSSQGA